jgi:hypothetical protein
LLKLKLPGGRIIQKGILLIGKWNFLEAVVGTYKHLLAMSLSEYPYGFSGQPLFDRQVDKFGVSGSGGKDGDTRPGTEPNIAVVVFGYGVEAITYQPFTSSVFLKLGAVKTSGPAIRSDPQIAAAILYYSFNMALGHPLFQSIIFKVVTLPIANSHPATAYYQYKGSSHVLKILSYDWGNIR